MKSPWPISILILTALCFSSDPRTELARTVVAPPDDVQVINVTAKKYEFDPSPIRVKQGARVQLKITATDHVHGFRLSDVADGAEAKGKPGLVFTSGPGCIRLEEGKTETVEFVAQAAGTYQIKCCVHCGWKHKGMKGELVVEP